MSWQTQTETFGVLESLNLLDHETEKIFTNFLKIFTYYLKNALFNSLMNLSMNSLIIIYFSFVTDRQTHCGFMSLLIMLIQIHEIINEFTNEFIELNLLIFCDRQTLWLLELPDLIDYKTENFFLIYGRNHQLIHF